VQDTVKSARILVELAAKRGDVSLFEPEATEQAGLWKKEVAKSRARELAELYDSGFGTHHAGMLRSDRNLTEKLFSMGLLKVGPAAAGSRSAVALDRHLCSGRWSVTDTLVQLLDPCFLRTF
jgi:activating signal cointegrator complex subunit 3